MMSELDMCRDIERRLLSIGVRCVRELQCCDGWIDIAVCGGGHRGGVRIAAIECKARSAWKKAVAQALLRQPFVDEAWICEPFRRGPSGECLAACRDHRIGVLRYEPEGTWPFSVVLSAMPDAERRPWWRHQRASTGHPWHLAERYDRDEQWRRRVKPRRGGLIAGQTMQRVVILDAALRRRLAKQLSLELVTERRPKKPRPVTVHRMALVPGLTICGVTVTDGASLEPVMNFMYVPGAPELRDCKRCADVWRVNRHSYRVKLIREQRRSLVPFTWQEQRAVANSGRGEESSAFAFAG